MIDKNYNYLKKNNIKISPLLGTLDIWWFTPNCIYRNMKKYKTKSIQDVVNSIKLRNKLYDIKWLDLSLTLSDLYNKYPWINIQGIHRMYCWNMNISNNNFLQRLRRWMSIKEAIDTPVIAQKRIKEVVIKEDKRALTEEEEKQKQKLFELYLSNPIIQNNIKIRGRYDDKKEYKSCGEWLQGKGYHDNITNLFFNYWPNDT